MCETRQFGLADDLLVVTLSINLARFSVDIARCPIHLNHTHNTPRTPTFVHSYAHRIQVFPRQVSKPFEPSVL